MESKIRSAIAMKDQPVAIRKLDHPPAGAMEFKEGGGGCVVAMLAAAAKGKTAAFREATVGCAGGKVGLGFSDALPPPVVEYLAGGGECYKQSSQLIRDYLAALPPVAPTQYLVFQPLDQVPEGAAPAAVVFLVNADQLSALATLASYDRPMEDNVRLSFGAGCAQAIRYPLGDSEAGKATCTIGLTDPSARLHLGKDLLSFSIPYPRFLEMEGNVEESFLTKGTWEQIKKRI